MWCMKRANVPTTCQTLWCPQHLGRAHRRPHRARGALPLVPASQLDHRSERGRPGGKGIPRLNVVDAEHGDRPHAEDVGEDSEPVMDRPIALPQSSRVEGPILRETLGFTGPSLAGFPPSLPFGSCDTGNADWNSGACIECCCIPSGLAHCKRTLQTCDSTLGLLPPLLTCGSH